MPLATAMKPAHFTIQSLSEGCHVLTREAETCEESFPTMQAALDFAKTMPGAQAAETRVVDADGQLLLTVHFGRS